MSTADVNDQPRARRAVRDDVVQARVAIGLLRPFNERIGGWQAVVARLITTGERQQTHSGGSAASAELAALEHAIADHRRRFTEIVGQMPPKVQVHSRVLDTVRALDSLADGAKRARSLLDGGKHGKAPTAEILG